MCTVTSFKWFRMNNFGFLLQVAVIAEIKNEYKYSCGKFEIVKVYKGYKYDFASEINFSVKKDCYCNQLKVGFYILLSAKEPWNEIGYKYGAMQMTNQVYLINLENEHRLENKLKYCDYSKPEPYLQYEHSLSSHSCPVCLYTVTQDLKNIICTFSVIIEVRFQFGRNNHYDQVPGSYQVLFIENVLVGDKIHLKNNISYSIIDGCICNLRGQYFLLSSITPRIKEGYHYNHIQLSSDVYFIKYNNKNKRKIKRALSRCSYSSDTYSGCPTAPYSCPTCLNSFSSDLEKRFCDLDIAVKMKISSKFEPQSEEDFFTSMCSTFDVQEVYRGNSSRFQKHVDAALRQHCSCDLFNEVPIDILLLSKEKVWITTEFNYSQLNLGKDVNILTFNEMNLGKIKQMTKNCKYSSNIQTYSHSVLPKSKLKTTSNDRQECPFTNQSSCPQCPSSTTIDLLSTYCLAKYAAVVSFSTDISHKIFKEPKEIKQKDQEKKGAGSQTGCLKEPIKFLYDVTAGKQAKLIKDSYQLLRPLYCRCSFLKSGIGYGLLLSHKKPKANVLQLSKEVQIYSLPLGETVIPVCPGEPSTPEYSSQEIVLPVLNELKEVSKPTRPTQFCPSDVQNSCPQCFYTFNETVDHLYCTAARVLLVYVDEIDREESVGANDYSLKIKVDAQTVLLWKSSNVSEGPNENIICISGSLDVEDDITKDTKTFYNNTKLDFYMKDDCQCFYIDYPVGYALMFFSKEEAVSKHPVQLTDEVTIIPVPYETLTLPNCL